MKIEKIIGNIDKDVILASKSPRRKHLLNLLGLDYEIIPSDIDENISEENPEEFARILAESKSYDIAKKNPGKIVIGADTIVVIDGNIINKPSGEVDAFCMLKSLSGKTHMVITGICIAKFENNILSYISDIEITEVTFRELSDIEIKEYVLTGSPMDKAGAYGIQDDFGAVFVSRINGCYYNIVGLPLQLLYNKLKEFHKNFL